MSASRVRHACWCGLRLSSDGGLRLSRDGLCQRLNCLAVPPFCSLHPRQEVYSAMLLLPRSGRHGWCEVGCVSTRRLPSTVHQRRIHRQVDGSRRDRWRHATGLLLFAPSSASPSFLCVRVQSLKYFEFVLDLPALLSSQTLSNSITHAAFTPTGLRSQEPSGLWTTISCVRDRNSRSRAVSQNQLSESVTMAMSFKNR